MPIVSMNVDYMRKKKKTPQTEETYQRVLKQFSMSPQRFRFEKFNHKKLGVIHPIPTKQPKINNQTSIPQPTTYQQGDKEFMEVKGKKCPIMDVEPDIMYSKNDKKQLDEHLVQPFFYVQKVFPTGETPACDHSDVFVPFQTLALSKRKGKTQKVDYKQILKDMTKEQRQEFYTIGKKINLQFALIFKRFIKGLSEEFMNKDYKMSMHTPKIKRKKILKEALRMKLIDTDIQKQVPFNNNTQDEQKNKQKKKTEMVCLQIPISYENMKKFLQNFGYDPDFINVDLDILFKNVIIGDSLLQMVNKQNQNINLEPINLNAFLYNVKKYMKLKYKIKDLFSVNAAKKRNVYIKFSLYPFLGEGWRVFKKQLTQLKKIENLIAQKVDSQVYQEYIEKRDLLIEKKRIWSKNLQRTPLQYILLKFQQVKDVYVKTINYNCDRIDLVNQFQIQFFDQRIMNNQSQVSESSNYIHMNEVIEFLLQKQYTREESNEIIEFFKKILKSVGLIKAPNKSKWQMAPEIQPEQILTQSQIVNYLSSYSDKQIKEWGIFKEFLGIFHDFQMEKLNLPEDRFQNVRQALECNLIGEWLIKQLKKIDKKLQLYLRQGLNICKLLNQNDLDQLSIEEILKNSDEMCSFDEFCEASTSEELKNLIQICEKNQLRNDSQFQNQSWDSDLNQAIQSYQVINNKIQQNKKKLEYNQKIDNQKQNVQVPQVISAAKFIDDRSFVQDEYIKSNQPVIVEKIPEIRSPKQQVGQAIQNNQTDSFLKPAQKVENTTQSLKNNQSSSTLLSEAELDMKIQNAMKLQNRIFSELGNIKDLRFRPM